MKILIVDDHAVVRRGVKDILEEWQPGIRIGEAQNAECALKHLSAEKWDIVILDISLPGKSGIVLLGQIREVYRDVPVLVLSMHSEDQYALRMLKAGAAGYMTKESASSELVSAVGRIMGGGKYISSTLADKLIAIQVDGLSNLLPHELLSDREYEVLRMIAVGKSVAEIAGTLSLSRKTVWTYKKNILDKMCLQKDADLIRYAVRHGMVH